jgi:uncharacterized damage-inducible protein DinB
MSHSKQLADRFREVMLYGTWTANTNYQDQLKDLTWQKAVTTVNSYNTVALLTFHINYYVEGVLHVLRGGELTIRDQYSFDAPELTSEEDWQELKNNLFTNSEAFAQEVEKLTNEQLQQAFVKDSYGTYQRNIEGMIEHCYYHLGQISLIRKTVLAN